MERGRKQYFKSKRMRVSEAYKWGDAQVLELLNLIVDAIGDAPKGFEKPTAQTFYLKIMSHSKTFDGLNFLVLKNKMRHLKSGYISAIEWKKTTGANLLATEFETQVTDYISTICPRFDLLHKIYGGAINTNVAVIKSEPSFHDPKHSPTLLSEAGVLSIIGDDENTYGDTQVNSQLSRSNTISRRSASPESGVCSSKITFHQLRNDMEEKKLQFQAQNAELDRAHAIRLKEMELQAHKELDIKKHEMTLRHQLEVKLKEFELKKYELNLKYNIQNM
ncbi:uncharacterized protein LOC119668192 [Teleopsis dalmanni]|uniref:uncharacterized protein LOC119668192 n=1 Tax=Teleopsis dalmanni TaxID=139649 RepID=UPI0018CE4115|nr:uncharacterized protein LOC119668192 [Teleopsis dalmanni]